MQLKELIGTGYRQVQIGEELKAGDKYLNSRGKWEYVYNFGLELSDTRKVYRRRIDQGAQVGPMARLNEAVLDQKRIKRVVALTQDGRAVTESYCGDYRVEKNAGELPVVGHYEQKGWMFKRWVFVPNDNEKGV